MISAFIANKGASKLVRKQRIDGAYNMMKRYEI
jgi:hypothetical protein